MRKLLDLEILSMLCNADGRTVKEMVRRMYPRITRKEYHSKQTEVAYRLKDLRIKGLLEFTRDLETGAKRWWIRRYFDN